MTILIYLTFLTSYNTSTNGLSIDKIFLVVRSFFNSFNEYEAVILVDLADDSEFGLFI